MNLLNYFRRRPPIENLAELAAFVDENAAFFVQKGIYEYSRARAGHYAKVLFSEQGFLRAVEESRWRTFPLGLFVVTELVEGIVGRAGDVSRTERIAALSDLTLSVFDRYPVPAAIGEQDWTTARADLSRRLMQIGLHPPKWAKDVPEPIAETYFNLMPIHEKLRAADNLAIRNYLRVTAINIHDEFTRRANIALLADFLGRRA